MSITYKFSKTALKRLQKLSPNIQQRIISKLDYFCIQPNPILYASRLSDFDLGSYRFRIGNYRVIFDLMNEDVILILDVGHRKEIYR